MKNPRTREKCNINRMTVTYKCPMNLSNLPPALLSRHTYMTRDIGGLYVCVCLMCVLSVCVCVCVWFMCVCVCVSFCVSVFLCLCLCVFLKIRESRKHHFLFMPHGKSMFHIKIYSRHNFYILQHYRTVLPYHPRKKKITF